MSTIFKLILWGISFIFPRSKRKWVFGSVMGFGGNTKYLYLNTKRSDIDYIWISPTRHEVKTLNELGYRAYYRNSLKGIYHCLTAGVWLYNSHLGDIKTAVAGSAFKVNLWHGVGLKKISHLNENRDELQKCGFWKRLSISIKRLRRLYMFTSPDIFLSTSDMMTNHFSEGFQIDKSVCVEGIYPRCSIFSWSRERLDHYISENEKGLDDIIRRVDSSSYTYVYMPTWRDTGQDFFKFSGINLTELDETLGRNNALMLIKMHFRTLNVRPEKPLENIIFIENKVDMYPLLPLTDCLITDYSSILYDYILIPDKDVVLYVPDKDYYIDSCRDLAFPFEENICGSVILEFSDLLQHISHKESFCLDDKYRAEIEQLKDKFWSRSALSQEEFVDLIKQRIGLK